MKSTQNLRQAGNDEQERSFVEEVRMIMQPTDPRAELLECGDRRLDSTLHHLCHTHCYTKLHHLVLLPHRLEQRPYKQPHHAFVITVITTDGGLEVEVGEQAHGVATGVADGEVRVLEALDDVADDFGEVGGGVGVGDTGEGEEAEGVLAGGGFWVGGHDVIEGVEEH